MVKIVLLRNCNGNGGENMPSYPQVKNLFKGYIFSTSTQTIDLKLINKETLEVKHVELEYIHRWTDTYKRRLLAKMYKLESWYKANPAPVTFFTFTTYQKDFKRLEDQYKFLKENFMKLRDNMRKILGKFDYFWVIEPHKTGYMHLHMMVFKPCTDDEKQRIIDLWCLKYEAGKEHAQDVQDVLCDNVDYIRTYLFKYLAKNLAADSIQQTKNAGLSTFNAVAWYMSKRNNDYTGIRFYGSSRHLTQVMKLDKKDDDEWICESAHLGDAMIHKWDVGGYSEIGNTVIDNVNILDNGFV